MLPTRVRQLLRRLRVDNELAEEIETHRSLIEQRLRDSRSWRCDGSELTMCAIEMCLQDPRVGRRPFRRNVDVYDSLNDDNVEQSAVLVAWVPYSAANDQ
jgi:hypothetical protein